MGQPPRSCTTYGRLEPLEPRLLLDAVYPTMHEQYMLELVNRARANPQAEVGRYGASYWDGTPDLNEGLPAGTLSAAPKQPLAFNLNIIDAARKHAQWMINTDIFDHNESANPADPMYDGQARMQTAGYAFVLPWAWGENIAWKGTTGTPDVTAYLWHLEGGLFGDAGIAGRGHRLNLMDGDYRQVGIGVVTGVFRSSGTNFNSVMVTEDFALSGDGLFLTGVAYDETGGIDNNFYTPGEGLNAVVVRAVRQSDGAVFATTTWSSGGYSLPIGPGTYTISAISPALGTVQINNVEIGAANVKVDFTPEGVVTSNPINELPVADARAATTAEDIAFRVALTGSDSETPDSQLVFKIVSGPRHGQLVLAADALPDTFFGNEYIYLPHANYNGPDSFTFTVTDTGSPPGSHQNPGDMTSIAATVSITVTAVNDRPTAAAQSARAAADETADITLEASDVETGFGALAFNVPATSDRGGTLVRIGQGQYRYTPPAGFVGGDYFDFSVTDSGDPSGTHGGGGDKTSAAARVSLDVRRDFWIEFTDRVQYTDAAHHVVTLFLSGGTGTIFFESEGDVDPHLLAISAAGTNAGLKVVVDDRALTTSTDVLVTGSMKTFDGRQVNLRGDLTFTGVVGQIRLNDAGDGHTISILGTGEGSAVKMSFADVTDLVIDSAMPVSSIAAASWTDTDATPDAVIAPLLGKLGVAGDFEAALTLNGTGATRDTLGGVRIGGNVTDADWDVSGTAGTISIAGQITNWVLHGTGGVLTGVRSLSLGDVVSGTVDIDGLLRALKAVRWQLGSVGAHEAGSLRIQGRKANTRTGAPAVPGDFGADVTLVGLPGSTKPTLASASVAGDVTASTWDITGFVGTVKIAGQVANWLLQSATGQLAGVKSLALGDVTNATVTANGGLGVVKVLRWLAGTLSARTVAGLKASGRRANPKKGVAAVAGDFNADVALAGSADPRKSTFATAAIAGDVTGAAWDITGTLRTLKVTGTVTNTTIRTSSDIGRATIGAAAGSDFLVGLDDNGKRHPTLAGDYADPEASIRSFKVAGLDRGSVARAFADSNICAAVIGTVTLTNPQWDNGAAGANPGEEFGLYALREIKSVKVADNADASRALFLKGAAGWTNTAVEDFHADTLA